MGTDQFERALKQARQSLLETGVRNNRLIHVNRKRKRVSALDIAGERTDIFRLLRVESKQMKFLHHDEEDPEDESDKEQDYQNREARCRDLILETSLDKDVLQVRLIINSRTSEQQQGATSSILPWAFCAGSRKKER